MKRLAKFFGREAAAGLGLILLTLVIFYFGFGLHHFGPRALSYVLVPSSDSFLLLSHIDGLIKHEWFPFGGIHSHFAGAPFGMDLRDWPLNNNLDGLVWKFLSLFTWNSVLIFNVYFVLGYPAAAAIMFLCLRRFRVTRMTAFAVGIIYAFLPFHFRRYEHIVLATYFILPVVIFYLLRLAAGRGLTRAHGQVWLRFGIFAFVLGSSFIYFPFFGCLLFCALGLVEALSRRKLRPLILAGLAVAVICVSVLVNVAPSIFQRVTHGVNQAALVRSSTETEVYGLKLTHLLLPPPDHTVAAFRALRAKYVGFPDIAVEGKFEYLGLIAIVGLGFALFQTVRSGRRSRTLATVGLFTLISILFGTVGGVGSVFATYVSPNFRGQNRISIVIATLALFAFAFVFDAWLKRRRERRQALAAQFVLVVLVFVGLKDQISKDLRVVPNVEETFSDREFISKIEKEFPHNGTTLQMPFVPFPENPQVERMVDYSHFRALIYSRRMTWSYGVMKGTLGSDKIAAVSQVPLKIQDVESMGYDGIYIDRFGYPDSGAALETLLQKQLGKPPIVSLNQRLSYFSLR